MYPMLIPVAVRFSAVSDPSMICMLSGPSPSMMSSSSSTSAWARVEFCPRVRNSTRSTFGASPQ